MRISIGHDAEELGRTVGPQGIDVQVDRLVAGHGIDHALGHVQAHLHPADLHQFHHRVARGQPLPQFRLLPRDKGIKGRADRGLVQSFLQLVPLSLPPLQGGRGSAMLSLPETAKVEIQVGPKGSAVQLQRSGGEEYV